MVKKKQGYIWLLVVIVFVIAGAIFLGVNLGVWMARVVGVEGGYIDILSGEVQHLDIGETYVNLMTPKRVAKTDITVAVAGKETYSVMKTRQAMVKDEINKVLRGKTYADMQGVEGQEGIKREIVEGLNKLFRTEDVVDVYFNTIIVH